MLRSHKLGIVFGLSLALAVGGALALAQLFGMGEYPGGHLRTVYEIFTEESPNPATFSLEITPLEDGNYRITSTTEAIESRENVELGLFSLFFLGYSFSPQSDKLDLAPLTALGEREIEPNKEYVLADSAHLSTQGATQIAGVDVIIGTYTHPDHPGQRAIIALPDVPTRKLLPFPPLLRVEQRDGGEYRIVDKVELIEFLHEPD